MVTYVQRWTWSPFFYFVKPVRKPCVIWAARASAQRCGCGTNGLEYAVAKYHALEHASEQKSKRHGVVVVLNHSYRCFGVSEKVGLSR